MKSASHRPLPRVFSTSQMSTYLTCPRQYCLRYVLKIPSLVVSPAIAAGSRVHAAIAAGTSLVDTDEQTMVNRAHTMLADMPPNPVMETTYEDRQNPGVMFGDILDQRFIGIFDVHWTDVSIAGDWKTGAFNPKYTSGLETQAYVLGELYKQRYDRDLDEFRFWFLKSGDVYSAKSLRHGRSRTAVEARIAKAIYGITARQFDRKPSVLCTYCDQQECCRANVGFMGGAL